MTGNLNVLFTRISLIVLLLCSSAVNAFTGSESCRGCHAQEFTAWQGSHHDLAMQLPDETTVLGDFDNASFTYNGVTTRFFRKGDKFIVNTDGEDGKLADFEVAYVFGVFPLQQYLLPLSRGRLQALSIAWDSRPAAEGGQRWYHLYPEESIDYTDPLHWTGTYQNWNTSCAECHSTDLKKNYTASSRSFDTQFEELNVGCEACHGPGDKHQSLAKENKLEGAKNSGFPTALAQRGTWSLAENAHIAQRTTALESNAQIDSCGRCHSRRGTLGDYHYGAELLDTHRLSMPQWPLYYPDGQILDEDYVYGSFVQSKMHQAGVVCSNCHEPHSLQLRAPGNAVCAQCHVPARYDSAQHHHHKEGSAGAECANCHMPETTYMGVDARRDHSMRVPRPDLSMVIGTPNACNQCHVEEDAPWALEALRQWGVQFRDTSTHPARAFQRIAQGDNRVVPQLAQIAADPATAPIWRATAMEALGEVGGGQALQAATQILYDDDPLLRTSTVRALAFLPLPQRIQLLDHLIDDPVTAVRMEVASSLAGVPLDQVPPEQAAKLSALFDEYVSVLSQDADMPGVQLQLGIFFVTRGDLQAAEAAYREALYLNRQMIPAYLNLADLLRAQGKDDEARKLLLQALEVAPENGNTLHALGLLETRSGEAEAALQYLQQAAELETQGTRHRFVYGIALHDLGQPANAIVQLQALLRSVPQSEEVLLALTNYCAELGQRDNALRYAKTLTQIAPGNRNYQQLYQSLSGKSP
ncbi:TPR repeat-containing protein YrrB [Halioglobus japonicus]|nr:TPR repeat-containing protein YrrB [Halioglobus japonicus]